jgi:hypothetical protein
MTAQDESDLKAFLEEHLSFSVGPPRSESCDNTHRLTKEFLTGRGLAVEVELAALQERGGRCCDCEVLMNALR